MKPKYICKIKGVCVGVGGGGIYLMRKKRKREGGGRFLAATAHKIHGWPFICYQMVQ